MRRTPILMLIAIMAFKVSAAATPLGGSSSNGGDPIVYRFETARHEAADLVAAITDRHFGEDVSSAVRDFLLANKALLVADILDSKHVWTDKTLRTCAETLPSKAVDINLSISSCKRTTIEEAVAILIHESTHHLGIIDEDFAYAVSSAVVFAKHGGRYDTLCERFRGTWQLVESLSPSKEHVHEISISPRGCGSFSVAGFPHKDGQALFKYRRNAVQQLGFDKVLNSYFTVHPGANAVAATFTLIDSDRDFSNPDDRVQGLISFQLDGSDRLLVHKHVFVYEDNGRNFDHLKNPRKHVFEGVYQRR